MDALPSTGSVAASSAAYSQLQGLMAAHGWRQRVHRASGLVLACN